MRAALADVRLGPFVNLFTDPRATSDVAYGQFGMSQSNGPSFAGEDTSRRFIRDSTGPASWQLFVGEAFTSSTMFAMRLMIQASEALPAVTANYRPSANTSAGQVYAATVNIPEGISEIVVSGMSSTDPPTDRAGIGFVFSSGAIGATVDVTRVLVARSATKTPYVDGTMGRWLGTPNASPSVGYPRLA